jgi:N utilization substance protein B
MRAVQILYQLDMRRQLIDDAIQNFYDTLYNAEADEPEPVQKPTPDTFMEQLVRGTAAAKTELDELISKHSENWRMDRMSAVDRNLLRMAVYEMKHLGTPAPVIIDEALDIAHRFSGEDAARFINGVLDAVMKAEG